MPVLYLLHGLSDDHTVWTRRTSLERHVSELPLIVIMPDGERSYYTNSKTDPLLAFEDYMTKDLIGFVDSVFPTVAHRSGRAIAGLSMGGYGAFKLALKHPDLYCAAASFSGALTAGSRELTTEGHETGARVSDWDREQTSIFGENPKDGPDDILWLLEHGPRGPKPKLRIDCGTEDFLYAANLTVHKRLEKLNIEHEYSERTGAHTWDYWDRAITDALPFLTRSLHIEPIIEEQATAPGSQ